MKVTISIDASKASDLIQNIANSIIPQAIEVTLNTGSNDAEIGAKEDVPVDTGNLRDSIHELERGENYRVVGTTEDYALAIERGTSRMPARPFIEPQADKLQTTLPHTLEEELKRRMP